MEDLAMMDSYMERHIGETMAEVLRERLIELEILVATRDAPEDTIGRLAFVRKMLVRFDARDIDLAKRQ
jgi:response regulator of citrate/malate metabolism